MGQTEVTIFIILINVILLILVTGIVIFIFQYRKRKIIYRKEKSEIETSHRAELLNVELEIRKETMQFIGRELHDSVTQKLTIAAITAKQMEYMNELPAMSEKLTGIIHNLDESMNELRMLSESLNSGAYLQSSLYELLLTECSRVNNSGICKASLEETGDEKLNETGKIFVLRVVQEFIQNSLKHSGCKLLLIEIDHTLAGFQLIAKDDGKGFDQDLIQNKGMGLYNMKRRISLAGGSFELRSEKEKGTEIRLFIPHEKSSAA